MDKIYAILNSNKEAINFVSWDGETYFDYGQSQGHEIILIPEDLSYDYGWTWDGSKFNNPAPEPHVEHRSTTGTEEF